MIVINGDILLHRLNCQATCIYMLYVFYMYVRVTSHTLETVMILINEATTKYDFVHVQYVAHVMMKVS